MERTEVRASKSYPNLEETERFYEAIPENFRAFCKRSLRLCSRANPDICSDVMHEQSCSWHLNFSHLGTITRRNPARTGRTFT